MRALILALLCAAAVTAGPVQVTPTPLDPHQQGRSAEMILADETVDIRLAGPVAEITVEQSWSYEGRWFSPGDEAITELRTGHLSALGDYWITEDGARHEGIVRDRTSAVGEYRQNVAQRRDPGLAEWIDEGRYRFHLYPVLAGGAIKKQGFRLLTVLPVRAGGRMDLKWEYPVYAVRKARIRVHGAVQLPNAGPEWRRAADGTLVLESEDLPTGAKSVDIVLSTPDVRAQAATLAWHDTARQRFLILGNDAAFIGPLSSAHAVQTARDLPRGLQLDSATIPPAWLALLEKSARALRYELDEGRLLDSLNELRAARIVGPEVVLFANPFATKQMIDRGWEDALKGIAARTAGTPSPSWSGALDFHVPEVVPTFKASRERANRRACFANQKTVIGALEMYNLDKNFKFQGEPVGFAAPAPAPRRSGESMAWVISTKRDLPDDVESSCWRGRARLAVYRAFRNLNDDPWERPVPEEFRRYPSWTTNEIRRIPQQMWDVLREGGYLQAIPRDPGHGEDTHHHYVMVDWGNGIFCLDHGAVDGNGDPARRQLERAGISDPAQLALANPQESPRVRAHGLLPGAGWIVALGVTALVALLLNLALLWNKRTRELEAAMRQSMNSACRTLACAIPCVLIPHLALALLFLTALATGRLAAAALHLNRRA